VGTRGSAVIDLTVPSQSRSAAPSFDVAIVGLGYVGLPTSLAFTNGGQSVVGYDVSQDRLEAIRTRDVDLLPSDHARLHQALDEGALRLSSSAAPLARAAMVMICVPTPVDRNLVPDLRLLESACATVVAHARPGQVLVLTSTTFVGSTRTMLVEPLERRGFRLGRDIFVAFSPERIDPGNAAFAQEDVPRVLGGVTSECTSRAEVALSAYARNVHTVSSPEAAELTKLYENTFRAVNIAFANEMADATKELGIDIIEIIDAAATKPYGFMAFSPGPGVGGHCIPCDPHYLLWQLKADRRSAPLVEQAMSSIAQRPRQVVARAREVLAETGTALRGARVLIVGLSYKPGVADVRESPAVEILDRLHAEGSLVEYYDPLVPRVWLDDGTVMTTSTDAPGRQFDLVLISTLHPSEGYGWIADQAVVLDTTYRYPSAPGRELL
jgi:nucleotide sugar dehydrogenase